MSHEDKTLLPACPSLTSAFSPLCNLTVVPVPLPLFFDSPALNLLIPLESSALPGLSLLVPAWILPFCQILMARYCSQCWCCMTLWWTKSLPQGPHVWVRDTERKNIHGIDSFRSKKYCEEGKIGSRFSFCPLPGSRLQSSIQMLPMGPEVSGGKPQSPTVPALSWALSVPLCPLA